MARKTTEGNIRKRSDGRWEARYTAGYDPHTGKQIQKSVYANSQKDAKLKLRTALANLDNEKLAQSEMKLEDWLDTWLTEYKLNDLSPATNEMYERIAKQHIKPHMGKMKLHSISTDDVQWFINQLQEKGSRKDDHKGGLAPASITKVRNILHGALEQARKNRYIPFNPVNGVVLPKQRKKPIVHLTPEQEKQFIGKLEGDLKPLFILALATGLRRGELLGLTWDCVDFKNRMLHVNKTAQRVYDPTTKTHQKTFADTKTYASTRKVPLMESVIPILAAHREAQESTKRDMGKTWNPHNLVFCSANGTIIEPHTVNRILNRTLRAAELPQIGIHALRHTFATRSLEQGVPAKVVQEILGHTDIALTLNTYTHVTKETAKKEISKLDDYFKLNLPSQDASKTEKPKGRER